jgi:acetyl-CoA C-acetyltransferase
VFREGGTATAGNSSGITDGAAAMLVMDERGRRLGVEVAGRIVGWSTAGVDPARGPRAGPAGALLDRTDEAMKST